MKIAGIITEYNPFHNGHLYHINQTRKLTGCDAIVCVMSGNFTQRGEPALISKQARTKSALLNGVDLVIELPFVYSCQSAEFFAFGAVKLLNSLGIIDYLCFGSEYDNVSDLTTVAKILSDEPEKFKFYLKDFLKEGHSFPAARQKALEKYFYNEKNKNVLHFEEILNSSNAILAVEYLKALYKLKSNIITYATKRIGSDYISENIEESFSSALSIRKTIHDFNKLDVNDFSHISKILNNVMPNSSVQILFDEILSGKAPVFLNGFDNIISTLLRRISPETIKSYPFVSEGLHNRLYNIAKKHSTFQRIVEEMQTRRYPATRIQRLLIHIITNLTKNQFSNIHNNNGPQYIRILGFNKKGKALLSDIKKNSTLPIVSSPLEIKNINNPVADKIFEYENISSNIYSLLFPNETLRISGYEYLNQIVKT